MNTVEARTVYHQFTVLRPVADDYYRTKCHQKRADSKTRTNTRSILHIYPLQLPVGFSIHNKIMLNNIALERINVNV